MNPGQAALERRRQTLVARIGAQRLQLEWQLDAFRRPLRAFELARALGETLRRNAKLAGALAACAGFLLMRSGVFSKALRILRLANTTTRWWLLARLGWHLVAPVNGPGGARRRCSVQRSER